MEDSINKNDLIVVRDWVESDKSIILASWLNGLRYGNDWFSLIDSKAYFYTYHTILETLLSRPETQIKIACLKDDPEVVLGYAVFTGNRLDWVFVKKAWRNIGIANQLVPDNIQVVTHVTKPGKAIMLKRKYVFNPFAF